MAPLLPSPEAVPDTSPVPLRIRVFLRRPGTPGRPADDLVLRRLTPDGQVRQLLSGVGVSDGDRPNLGHGDRGGSPDRAARRCARRRTVHDPAICRVTVCGHHEQLAVRTTGESGCVHQQLHGVARSAPGRRWPAGTPRLRRCPALSARRRPAGSWAGLRGGGATDRDRTAERDQDHRGGRGEGPQQAVPGLRPLLPAYRAQNAT